ncbi:MAG: hypothetical protein ACOY90_13325 [Candidatus Zhuqueibacterota bacterium]
MTDPLKSTLIQLFIIAAISPSVTFAQADQSAWLFKTRIQQGFEYDSNTLEAKENLESDALYKLILSTQAKISGKGWLGQLHYHGGFHRYFFSPSENKLTNDLQTYFVHNLMKNRISIGGQALVRFKYFHHHDWEYSLSNIEPFIAATVFQTRLAISFNFEQLHYFEYDQFNFKARTISLSAGKRLHGNVRLQLKAGQQTRNYDRFALVYKPFLDSALYSNLLQKDVFNFGGFELSLQKRMLCSIEYVFQDNASNSYGFTYTQHRLTVSAAVPLKNGMLIRLLSGLQRKEYAESLNRIIVTELDTERENSNFFIIDFSRNLSSTLNLLVRGSWFNNESPIPGRYYQKSLTSICLEYSF